MSKNLRVYVWALGLAFLASSEVLAAGREVALGSDGEMYAVRTGSYGQLYPQGRSFDRANTVVALDITKPGVPVQRVLVPGTGGSEIERSPSVLFEDDSETVFLLWETELGIHPILQLAGFDGTSWSKPIEVIGNPFAFKTSIQFTITRDLYEEAQAGGSMVPRHRTLLHLVWQEETASGGLATLYSPIVINDGKYIGWNPVFNLDEYLQERITASSAEVQASLASAPIIESGQDERTIVIAYASTALGRLASIEIDVLPQQLIQLADAARMHIVDLGREFYPHNLSALAEKARMHIVDLGHAFRPEIVQAIAKQVQEQILAGGTDGLGPLADKARMHIVDLGAQLSGRGLRGAKGADATAKLLEIEEDPSLPESSASFLFQFRVVSDLPVPHVEPGEVRLFVSAAGEDVTVSWAQADKVLYRNSRNDRWTELREIQFSKDLNLAKAYEILQQRLGQR